MKDKQRLSENYSNGTQSVNYTALYKILGEKIRIKIKKDSYDFQSHAIAEIFQNSTAAKKWERLASIPFANMEVNKKGVFYQRKVNESGHGLTTEEKNAFQKDIIRLLKEATLILE
jgi:hypothetical protein